MGVGGHGGVQLHKYAPWHEDSAVAERSHAGQRATLRGRRAAPCVCETRGLRTGGHGAAQVCAVSPSRAPLCVCNDTTVCTATRTHSHRTAPPHGDTRACKSCHTHRHSAVQRWGTRGVSVSSVHHQLDPWPPNSTPPKVAHTRVQILPHASTRGRAKLGHMECECEQCAPPPGPTATELPPHGDTRACKSCHTHRHTAVQSGGTRGVSVSSVHCHPDPQPQNCPSSPPR